MKPPVNVVKARTSRSGRRPGPRDVASRLQSLDRDGASAPEVMKALREAGIGDLEELVRRVIGKTALEPETLDLFAPVPSPQMPPEQITHKPPRIPFVMGDVTYDPGDIKRFNGQTLHFVLRPLADGEHALLAFSGADWLRSLTCYFQMRQHASLVSAGGGGAGGQVAPLYLIVGGGKDWYPGKDTGKGGVVVYPHPPGTEVLSLLGRFYEDVNFKGDTLYLAANRVWPDLTKRSRGFLGLGDWNDVICSVQTAGATLLLFEHIQFGGDTLLITPYDITADLGKFGFDERTSSIKNFGSIY
jgi:hypothetical protein